MLISTMTDVQSEEGHPCHILGICHTGREKCRPELGWQFSIMCARNGRINLIHDLWPSIVGGGGGHGRNVPLCRKATNNGKLLEIK